jgi:transcription elongation factor GreB
MSLPAGTNYITPQGLERLKDTLRDLIHRERPALVKVVAWAASNGDRSENADYIYGKKRLREIDKLAGQLTKKIENAQIVDPKSIKSEKIVFGATVTIADEEGKEKTYQIVGQDEIDTIRGKISWQSPIAKALIGKKVGDDVTVELPNGKSYYEIIEVKFV